MSLQDKVNAIREANGTETVAAQDVVDHDNPAWTALRKAAQMRADLPTDDPHMVLVLHMDTGVSEILMSERVDMVVLSPGAPATPVRSPRLFSSEGAAEVWCEINADPDNVRYMVVKPISDEVHEKKNRRLKLNRANLERLLTKAGYVLTEENVWASARLTFDDSYIDGVTYNELNRLLFGQ